MIGVTNKQIAMRLGQMILVLLGISFITFCLVMLAPGDVVRQMIAGNEDIVVSQAEMDALRHELGLDQPFFMQYLSWLGRVLQGNFGFLYDEETRTGCGYGSFARYGYSCVCFFRFYAFVCYSTGDIYGS